MKYEDYNDNELMYMVSESSEEAKDILFEKYKYIIDIIYKKYRNAGVALGLEESDLYQEALVGFSDALNAYKDDKQAKLATFITLCIERRLKVTIAKAGRLKHRMINDSLSLESSYGNDMVPLLEMLGDDKNNPLDNLMDDEEYKNLLERIHEELSDNENEVFQLLMNGFSYMEIAKLLDRTPKSVDNSIQRLKLKIRKILSER